MAKVRISKGKFEGISACADDKGVIAAAAMISAAHFRRRSPKRVVMVARLVRPICSRSRRQ